MHVIKDLDSLQTWKSDQRRAGKHWTLVPTMGNLHAGHLSLMRQAQQQTACVIASIYVNPTQFGIHEDFGSYPRTPQADIEKLTAVGVDAVFMPTDELIYPYGKDEAIGYTLPERFTNILCGARRLGHFHGVVAVVSRLFHLIEPQYAVFGAKDYQQQWILRRMVKDLHFPITITTGDIVREEDGLAMSSRNQYLSSEERKLAPTLHRILQDCRSAIECGAQIEATLHTAMDTLKRAGFEPEYLELRTQADLVLAQNLHAPVVLLVAAKLGTTRLIDNIAFG